MSVLQSMVEKVMSQIKNDPGYRISSHFSNRQLASILWYRGWQLVRGASLGLFARHVEGPVFRGRRAVVEHAYQLSAGPGLILEDGALISALSVRGVQLGRNVTIARGAILTCTGVIARIGEGIRIGDRSAVGAGSFIGGQGGVAIGDDVIMGAAVRIFSENHEYALLDRPIRAQGETRRGVAIGDDCWIGAGVTILDGVTIGTGSVIAAGAVVTRTVPPFSIAGGVPARLIGSRQAARQTVALPESASRFVPAQALPSHAHTHQEGR